MKREKKLDFFFFFKTLVFKKNVVQRYGYFKVKTGFGNFRTSFQRNLCCGGEIKFTA